MRIYVGNIPFKVTEDQIRAQFEGFGPVAKVDLVMDRETQRPRGFAFVDMDDDGGKQAIEQLDGTDFGGRRMTVNQAKERSGGGGGQRSRAPRGGDSWDY